MNFFHPLNLTQSSTTKRVFALPSPLVLLADSWKPVRCGINQLVFAANKRRPVIPNSAHCLYRVAESSRIAIFVIWQQLKHMFQPQFKRSAPIE